MAKVFAVTLLELNQGVDEQEFIKFIVEEFTPILERLGEKFYLIKADRGERTGKFATLWEWPSVEQRNRFWPAEGQNSEEANALLGPEFGQKMEKLMQYVTGYPWSDYIEQA